VNVLKREGFFVFLRGIFFFILVLLVDIKTQIYDSNPLGRIKRWIRFVSKFYVTKKRVLNYFNSSCDISLVWFFFVGFFQNSIYNNKKTSNSQKSKDTSQWRQLDRIQMVLFFMDSCCDLNDCPHNKMMCLTQSLNLKCLFYYTSCSLYTLQNRGNVSDTYHSWCNKLNLLRERYFNTRINQG